jgi:hypothetical protein
MGIHLTQASLYYHGITTIPRRLLGYNKHMEAEQTDGDCDTPNATIAMFQTAASHHHPRPCPLDLQE